MKLVCANYFWIVSVNCKICTPDGFLFFESFEPVRSFVSCWVAMKSQRFQYMRTSQLCLFPLHNLVDKCNPCTSNNLSLSVETNSL